MRDTIRGHDDDPPEPRHARIAPTRAVSCAPTDAGSTAQARGLGPSPPRLRQAHLHRPPRPARDHPGRHRRRRRPRGAASGEPLRSEFVVAFEGDVALRQPGTENPKLPTGAIELQARSVRILNEAKTPPFYINDPDAPIDESLRLQVPLPRHPARADGSAGCCCAAGSSRRSARSTTRNGFVEVETPNLIKSTPEGARDFIVPSRLQPGTVYALPQSPQQLKQLLMVARHRPLLPDRALLPRRGPARRPAAGVHAARPRDELRRRGRVTAFVERMVIEVSRSTVPERQIREVPFPRVRVRGGDGAVRVATSRTSGSRWSCSTWRPRSRRRRRARVRVPRVRRDARRRWPGQGRSRRPAWAASTRREIDDLTETAKRFGARGLVHLAVQAGGELHGPIAKFLSPETPGRDPRRAGRVGGRPDPRRRRQRPTRRTTSSAGSASSSAPGSASPTRTSSRTAGSTASRCTSGTPRAAVGTRRTTRSAACVPEDEPLLTTNRATSTSARPTIRPAAPGPCSTTSCSTAGSSGAARSGSGPGPARAELQPPGLHARADARALRRDARGVRVRGAAARRDRARHRPLGGAVQRTRRTSARSWRSRRRSRARTRCSRRRLRRRPSSTRSSDCGSWASPGATEDRGRGRDPAVDRR